MKPIKNKITALANAKINLSLNITGKCDDGYHTIDTVMQSVTLNDKVTVKISDKITVDCSDQTLKSEDNIAFSAAKLFFEKAGFKGGAEIYIEKHIPTAAGLGGGSSDAAAVLLSLNKLYGEPMSENDLSEIAVKLGADVPFFINGGTQRAVGIGEKLTPLKPLTEGYFLIAKQGKKQSTGEMYRLLDKQKKTFADTESVISACERNDLHSLAKATGNSFSVLWLDSPLYKRLCNSGAVGCGLSGSGPSFFAIFSEYKTASKLRNELKSDGIECFVTQPAEKSIIFVTE